MSAKKILAKTAQYYGTFAILARIVGAIPVPDRFVPAFDRAAERVGEKSAEKLMNFLLGPDYYPPKQADKSWLYGHCDTCGAPCDRNGCMSERTHVAAKEA